MAHPAPVQYFSGKVVPSPHLVNPVGCFRSLPWCKPETGGLWTSDPAEVFVSTWREWQIAEEFLPDRFTRVWRLHVTPGAEVYTIDSLADLERLIRIYRHSSSDLTYPGGDHVHWESVGQEFDAVYLTEKGEWATRFTTPGLYGWDCASTLWFNWQFTNVEEVEIGQSTIGSVVGADSD